jgi:3-oxoacyl-ACP reductase-like protein
VQSQQVITASCCSRATAEYYQGNFQRFSSRGSALTNIPFNQGPKQDVEAFIDYSTSKLLSKLLYYRFYRIKKY